MRLLAGILAGQKFKSTLTGDASLRSRPMQRIIEPLTMMGAIINSDDGHAPLTITGQRFLKAISFDLLVASAQVKSCILFAGLNAKGCTEVTEEFILATTLNACSIIFVCRLKREPERARARKLLP